MKQYSLTCALLRASYPTWTVPISYRNSYDHRNLFHYRARTLVAKQTKLILNQFTSRIGEQATPPACRGAGDRLWRLLVILFLGIRTATAFCTASAAELGSSEAEVRGASGFKSPKAEANGRIGQQPLRWDSKPTAEFELMFDEPTAPELSQLRTEFALEGVVDGAKDDYERLVRLTLWTSRQWEHSSSQMASKPDPLTILREAKAGGKFICRDYAIVVAATARAFGMKSRVLAILPKEVETRSRAHSVAEIWLPQFRKWVLADGQFGIIPELDGKPLNGIELQKALNDGAPIVCRGAAERGKEWKEFIVSNLFYFKIAQDQRRFGGKPSRQLVLVPVGAHQPHKFAGGNESVFANATYTSNPQPFYAEPKDRQNQMESQRQLNN